MLLAVIAPVVVATVSALRTPWWPTMDLAIEYLRSMDVGTADTPLIGAYSRMGYNHPGPFMFYLFAPFVRLMGPHGMFLASGLLAIGCVTGIIAIAYRRSGHFGAVLAGGACLIMFHAASLTNILGAWNPWIGLLPFLLSTFCAWAVLEGDTWFLPLLVAAASFSVQSHLGYGGVAALVMITPAFALVARHRRRTLSIVRQHLRPVIVTIGVGTIMWAPPLVNQLHGQPGNITLVIQNFTGPGQPTATLRAAGGMLAAFFSPLSDWYAGQNGSSGPPPSASLIWPIAASLGALTLGALARRHGSRSSFMFAAMLVAANAIGLFSIAKIQGPVATYLVAWGLVLGVMTAFSIVWFASVLMRSRRPARRDASALHSRPIALGALRALGALTVIVLAATMVPGARTVEPDDPQAGEVARSIAEATAPHLRSHGAYLLDWREARFVNLQVGFLAGVEAHGRHLVVPATQKNLNALGAGRVLSKGTETLGTVHVYPLNWRPASTFRPHPGETVLIRSDRLSPPQRARALALKAKLATARANLLREWQRAIKRFPSESPSVDPQLDVVRVARFDPVVRRGVADVLRLTAELDALAVPLSSFVVTVSSKR